MKKSLLVASLAVISMNVLGMNNRDVVRENYSEASLRGITNLSNTETSTFSRKRSRANSDSQRSAQRRRISDSSDQIQISDDVAGKIDDYVEKYGSYKTRGFDKNFVREILIKILTEPNKSIAQIAKEYEVNDRLAASWVSKAGLSSERQNLVNSYCDSKLRLAKAILEYPEKGWMQAADDNGVNRGTLSCALRRLSNEDKIVLKKVQEDKASRQRTLNFLEAYYEGKDLEDLCKILKKDEKETKSILGKFMYATLSNAEKEQLLTEYSGLIKDSREGFLTDKGRINKWRVSKVKDYLVTHIARKLAIKVEKARKKEIYIEESNWWSKKFDPDSKEGDWWHRESELKYKTEGEVPEETKEDMVVVYNERHLTRKGIAKLYKTKKTIVSNIFSHKKTSNVINVTKGRGDLKEVILDLLTKSPDEVKTKYGFKDRTIKDRLVVIDCWRELTDDQKNAFKKAMKTEKMPDLSAIESYKGKNSRYVNDNFRKYLFALTSTDEEIIEKYYKNANIKQKKDNVYRLRKKVTMWTILAEQDRSLLNRR